MLKGGALERETTVCNDLITFSLILPLAFLCLNSLLKIKGFLVPEMLRKSLKARKAVIWA